ncbi:energy transducer TonB [bacterium]|nr:energy transducer TonB [bacterium]
MRDNPTKALRLQYKRTLELGLIVSLILTIFLMQAYKKIEIKTATRTVQLEAVQVEEIPQTQQEKTQAAPSRPTVPIASDDEDLPEDETIDFTDLDLEAEPPPPPPPPTAAIDEETPVFIPYDEPPDPIGGYEAIQRRLVYPEIAKKAGVEGRVIIQALIDERGNVINTVVMQSLGPNGCDEAAAAAIQSVKWKPAMQRDEPVKVWIAVPVDFQLR